MKNTINFNLKLQSMVPYDLQSIPGSVLEKKLTGGLGLFFLGLKFFMFLFFWVWKNLSNFFGSEDFSLIFFGVTILIQFIFFGCPIKRS